MEVDNHFDSPADGAVSSIVGNNQAGYSAGAAASSIIGNGPTSYSSTHDRGMHIDIPTFPPSQSHIDHPSMLDGNVLGETPSGPLDGENEASTPSAARPPPSKGILKNGFRRPSAIDLDRPATDAERVQWDEKNLQETEIGKDSLMKIDEPKTPYVWGNPEKDMQLSDVPDMDLSSPQRRPSMTSTRSSSSSRSASFSLPPKKSPPAHLITPSPHDGPTGGDISAIPTGQGLEVTGMALGATSANTALNAQRSHVVEGGDVFDDDEEEMDEEAKEKHREFKGKRKEHYAMEAKAALAKARELQKEDEANGNGDEDDDDMEVEPKDEEAAPSAGF